MLEWISQNIATIIICAVLIGVVAAIIAGMVRNKLKGKSSCGCGCADCPMNGSCHSGK
ncbi:MAG: FeoB-associated Cys-rich membrane protein [Ruminiclostridium sp.]